MSALALARPALSPLATGTRRAVAQIAAMLDSLGVARRAIHETERLLALSDAELSCRGLRRDEVVTRTFAKYMAA